MSLLIAALMTAGPLAANATAVTFDFTGTVADATGTYSSLVGSAITGTFTIDFANGTLAPNGGPIGSTGEIGWGSQEIGGSYYGSPTGPGLVFSSTATVGALVYSSGPASPFLNSSSVEGVWGFFDDYYFVASENQETSAAASTGTGSGFTLNSARPDYPFTSNGLPVLTSDSISATGGFYTDGNANSLGYNITSLTPAPVPLPGALWLMLSGLGVLVARMTARPPHANQSLL